MIVILENNELHHLHIPRYYFENHDIISIREINNTAGLYCFSFFFSFLFFIYWSFYLFYSSAVFCFCCCGFLSSIILYLYFIKTFYFFDLCFCTWFFNLHVCACPVEGKHEEIMQRISNLLFLSSYSDLKGTFLWFSAVRFVKVM